MTAPPEKSGAVLAAPKTEPAGEYPPCTHSATARETLPTGHAHFAKVICVKCGVFIRWLPRPETIERRHLNGFRLAKLAMCAGLDAWERNFVCDVSRQRKLSPRQQEIVNKLAAKYLKEALA